MNVAQAEDTYNLLHHIAWTDVVKPKLDEQIRKYSEMLVAEALGNPLPPNLTREKVAGMCYGIKYMTDLFEQILRKGEKALRDLNDVGIHIQEK